MDVAAGRGALANEPTDEVGHLDFRRERLDGRGLDATACVVLGVRGESMEPTIAAGSIVLVNRSSRHPQPGRINVFRDGDTLLVKHLGGHDARGWKLLSDHPGHYPVRIPDDAVLLGEVVWASRTEGLDREPPLNHRTRNRT